MDTSGALVLERGGTAQSTQGTEQPEAVRLELYTQRFATLVGEMGERLERTAVSTNVKERLDFSCALLDAGGELVANAPHIPVHLGALGLCVRRVRETLNPRAPRVLCVVEPLKVVITNYPDDAVDWLEAPYFPRDVEEPPTDWPATRRIPFSANLYVERSDFEEEPSSGFKRLAPGREVRLRHGFFITCDEVIKDEAGEVVELRCTYDPETMGGSAPDGRKPSGTIHWVSADAAVPAEVRLYDRLFKAADPYDGVEDFRDNLNPDSLEIVEARVEPALRLAEHSVQFERLGYFCPDAMDHSEEKMVFNRIVTLRDTWAKVEKAALQQQS